MLIHSLIGHLLASGAGLDTRAHGLALAAASAPDILAAVPNGAGNSTTPAADEVNTPAVHAPAANTVVHVHTAGAHTATVAASTPNVPLHSTIDHLASRHHPVAGAGPEGATDHAPTHQELSVPLSFYLTSQFQVLIRVSRTTPAYYQAYATPGSLVHAPTNAAGNSAGAYGVTIPATAATSPYANPVVTSTTTGLALQPKLKKPRKKTKGVSDPAVTQDPVEKKKKTKTKTAQGGEHADGSAAASTLDAMVRPRHIVAALGEMMFDHPAQQEYLGVHASVPDVPCQLDHRAPAEVAPRVGTRSSNRRGHAAA